MLLLYLLQYGFFSTGMNIVSSTTVFFLISTGMVIMFPSVWLLCPLQHGFPFHRYGHCVSASIVFFSTGMFIMSPSLRFFLHRYGYVSFTVFFLSSPVWLCLLHCGFFCLHRYGYYVSFSVVMSPSMWFFFSTSMVIMSPSIRWDLFFGRGGCLLFFLGEGVSTSMVWLLCLLQYDFCNDLD